jgi:hypothetical protein
VKDSITYQIFQNLPEVVLDIWLRLYNKVWSEGIYIDAWKEVYVILIYKIGNDKSEPKSYRPICLTSNSGNLLEGMVKVRLEYLLE